MFQVQFITHFTDKISYVGSVCIALEGGCRWVQLRMKDATDDVAEATALEVQSLCRDRGAFFVIDDRVELAKKIGADGVHLGKTDMPVADARVYLGPKICIGGTANTFEDVRRLYADGADYIGCGPYRYTSTKKNLAPILGADGYRNIIARMKQENIDIPMIGIGGIRVEDIGSLKSIGLSGIALSSSVLCAEYPVDEMRRIIELSK